MFDLFVPVFAGCICSFSMIVLNSCTHNLCDRSASVSPGGVVYEHSSDHNCKNKSQKGDTVKVKGK